MKKQGCEEKYEIRDHQRLGGRDTVVETAKNDDVSIEEGLHDGFVVESDQFKFIEQLKFVVALFQGCHSLPKECKYCCSVHPDNQNGNRV
jgi:hypothetical protein